MRWKTVAVFMQIKYLLCESITKRLEKNFNIKCNQMKITTNFFGLFVVKLSLFDLIVNYAKISEGFHQFLIKKRIFETICCSKFLTTMYSILILLKI
jgi:hypothetical protein